MFDNMFDNFKWKKDEIPTPESIYALTILMTSTTVITMSCYLEYLSKNVYPKNKEKEKIVKQEPISLQQESSIVTLTPTEEPINLLPYFKEEADALYREHAAVVYNDKIYHLKDLYTLSNEDNSFVCYLDKESYYYHDLDTDAAIAINGYEDMFNYKIENLFSLFPYDEKYGTPEQSLILEEDFRAGLQKMNHKSSETQLIKKR